MVRSKTDIVDERRLKVDELLPGYVRTEVIQNAFENTINKFLTKEDSTYISGGIGQTSTPKIPETNIFRTLNQLQPLILSKNGTDEQILSQEDILIWLRDMGADVSKLGEWSKTLESNLALPINPEKIINYVDYFWVSDIDDEPDYVVMKDRDKIAEARRKHMERIVFEFGEMDVARVSENGRRISIENDFIGLENLTLVEISINDTPTGVFNVRSVETDAIYYNINLSTSLDYDEGDEITVNISPELDRVISEEGLLRTGYLWNSANNHWKLTNNWVHKNDIDDISVQSAIRATQPIIEFEDYVEMNEWISVTHLWKKWDDVNLSWVETTVQPTKDEIWSNFESRLINPTFNDEWIYVGIVDTNEVGGVVENENHTILRNYGTDGMGANITLQPDLRTINIPQAFVSKTLYGTMTTSIFVDGILQEGTYKEDSTTTAWEGIEYEHILSFEFLEALDISSNIEIVLTPLGLGDEYRYLVPITTEDGEIIMGDISTNVKVGQVKYNKNQFPKFNIYDLSGNFLQSSEIVDYDRDANAGGIRLDSIQNFPVLQNNLISENNSIGAYRDLRDGNLKTFWDGGKETSIVKLVDGSENIIESWDILPHMANIKNDTKHEFEVNELAPHFLSLLEAQEYNIIGEGLPNNLNYDIDYSKGGTIKFHDNCLSIIVSLILSDVDLLDVITNANELYQQLLNEVRIFVTDYISDYGISSEATPYSKLNVEIYDEIVKKISNNNYYRKILNDSSFSRRGFLWIDTLASFGWVEKTQPMAIIDERLGLKQILHHDGHISSFLVGEGIIDELYDSIANYNITPTRQRGWSQYSSPDSGDIIENREDIPVSRLIAGDVWLEYSSNTLYKLDLVYIGAEEPDKNYVLGSKWYNTTNDTIYELGNSGNIRFQEWRPQQETIAEQWIKLDLENIIIETILQIERTLYNLSPDINAGIVELLEEGENTDTYEGRLHEAFNYYKREMGITSSDDRSYDPRNPFTWNYKNVLIGHPAVIYPYNKNSGLWASRYEKIYENIFGTDIPHLMPWRMQGFTDKPSWWDNEYKTFEGYWSPQMWDNIKKGKTPSAGGSLTNLKKYDFVPVNTTNETTYDGYGPGDLLPPFWIFEGDGAKNAADALAENSVLIRDQLIIDEMRLIIDDPNEYHFGEGGPTETAWRKSSRYNYDRIISLIAQSPIKLINLLWGCDNVVINKMTCDSFNSKIVTNDIPLHGQEGVNGITYYNGIGQWLVNYNRFSDSNGASFHNNWYGWDERYGYLFDSFVDPKSLELVNVGEQVSKSDYSLHIKKTKNKNKLEISGLQIRVKKFGAHVLRNNKRVPRGYGHDWVFEINSPLITNFGLLTPKISTVNEVDLPNSTLVIGKHNFETGDEVDLATNDTLPKPLRMDRPFYIIRVSDTEIRLATTRKKANDGEFAIFTEYEGIGFIEVSKNNRKFFAMGGSNTAIEWKFSELTNDVEFINFPLEVTGVQNLIDTVRGISEYSERVIGIKPNPDGEALDPQFGKLTSWVTEIEKMVDGIFRGEGDGSSEGNETDIAAYEVVFNPISDTMEINNKGAKFVNGDEVYLYTSSVVPDGLIKGEPYYIIETSSPSVFRLATSKVKAEMGDYIDFQTNGSGRQYLTISRMSGSEFSEWIEVNPYYGNFWIPTNEGCVEEIDFSHDLITSDGKTIDSGDVFLYRYDRGTKLIMRNDQRRFLAGRFNITTSEHALIFNRRSINGPILYDSLTGQGLDGIDVISYKRIDGGVGRASFGGYVINKNIVSPNFEKMIVDLNEAYRQFSRETDFSDFKRDLLGYPDNFMDGLGLSVDSKFQFWKSMIHKRGTRETIEVLSALDEMAEVEIDELWAFRKALYGSSEVNKFMEFFISPDYLNGSDLWISSRNISTRVVSHNTEISDDPIVPPTIDCDYLLDADDLGDYGEMIEEMELPNTKVMKEISGTDNTFEITFEENDTFFTRASYSLLSQFNDTSLSFRGDSNISRPNMVGFQLNVTNPFKESTFGTFGERYILRTYLLGKDSSGRGNASRVDITYHVGGVVDVESYYQDGNGNWENGFTYTSVKTAYQEEYKIGFYIRKNTKSIGVVLDGEDRTVFDLEDFPNTSDYFFENLGVIIGTEFKYDGTTTNTIRSLKGKVEFVSKVEDFQDGFPVGTITNICSSMLIGVSCLYSTEPLGATRLEKASTVLFGGADVRDLGQTATDNTGMEKILKLENTNGDKINYLNLSEYMKGKLDSSEVSTSMNGDLQLEQPNTYSMGIKLDNYLGANNLTQLGSSARVGFMYRGIDVSLNEQWEFELKMTAGQTVMESGFSNTIELVGELRRTSPIEDGGGEVEISATNINRIITLDGIQDLTQLEFGLYIDTIRSTLSVVANAEDYGILDDVDGNPIFINGNHNTMTLNGYFAPIAEVTIDGNSEDRIGDDIRFTVLTRLDLIGDEYGETAPICDNEPLEYDGGGTMDDIDFNWGKVAGNNDSVIRIGDRWGNHMSTIYGEV